MQGKSDPGRHLLDAAALCRDLVEEGTIYAFLADHRSDLFKDPDFADLFPSGRGRPSIPVELICSVMVLQALEGLSDRDAVRQLKTRIDWKVACGLALDDPGFDFTNLTYWRSRLRRSRHDYSSAAKPVIDWSDRAERDGVVSELVADALDVIEATQGAQLSADQADAVGMLALVSAQDVEPGEHPGTWRIARKVAKDRMISTVDPEARHGHKSVSVRKDGFKAHICVEPGTGIVTAAKLTPANHPDGPAGLELMTAEPEGLEVLADSAYGSGPTRTGLKAKGHRLVIKPLPSHPAVPGGLRRDDFSVDHGSRRVTCPAGHVARLSPGGVAKFAPHCQSCPLRSACTSAKARTFSVGPNDAELVAARAAWRDPGLIATYRQHRPMAERSISWLVSKGNRRLRYRGAERNDAWLHVRVAALNLRRLLALGLGYDDGWVLASG